MGETLSNDDGLSMFGIDPVLPSEDGNPASPEENPSGKKPKVARPLKKNRPPAPKEAETGPEVWFPCRAKEDCAGRSSRLLLKVKKPGGGAVLRYRCLTCNRIFSITT